MTKDFRKYRFGASGDHVKALQEFLMDAGYDLPKYGADGHLGPETMSAVQQLESDHAFTDSCSWVIDPSTLAFIDNSGGCNPKPPSSNPNVPQGKGIFQRAWHHMGDSPDVAASWCVSHGLQWIALQRLWQYANPDDDKWHNGAGHNGHSAKEWVQALVEAGVQPWIWGWPVPGRESDFVAAMSETADAWGAVGIIADCEGPWYQNGTASEAARRLIDGLQSTGQPVGFTSYGAPWNFPEMPWEEFSRADFGIPQIYDSQNNQADDYPSRSVAEWQSMGFQAVVPASAAYNKTKSQMESLLARTPTLENALIWWDWYNANQTSHAWEVIKNYSFPEKVEMEALTVTGEPGSTS